MLICLWYVLLLILYDKGFLGMLLVIVEKLLVVWVGRLWNKIVGYCEWFFFMNFIYFVVSWVREVWLGLWMCILSGREFFGFVKNFGKLFCVEFGVNFLLCNFDLNLVISFFFGNGLKIFVFVLFFFIEVKWML